MEFSNYQRVIFENVSHGTKNVIVNAVAGSGKTTTIVEACRRLGLPKNKTLFLAFNRAIANELSAKLDRYSEVGTCHQFGFSVIRKFNKRVRVDNWKWRKYIQENVYTLSRCVTIDTPSAKVYGFCKNVLSLFDLCRVNLIQHGDVDGIRKVCDSHNLMQLWDEINVVNELLSICYDVNVNVIDFTDMIVLPLYLKQYIPTYNVVFIDECQDLCTAQRELMLCACGKHGRFVAVGDRRQAINGFAGADCGSFDKIASIANTIELPLSVNYRCGEGIISLAKEIVPYIECHDGACVGHVEHTKLVSGDMFRSGDMVLCRTSAPLVGMCLKLIENGITAVVKGQDIAEQLINLSDKCICTTLESITESLNAELRKCINTLKKERKCSEADAKESSRYINLQDRCNCIMNIAKSVNDVYNIKNYIRMIFDEKRMRGAVLSTIHKAKGLEADRVHILCPHKLPLTWRGQADWQLEQEINLKYVAITRAKKELYFIDLTEEELIKLHF